jgi:tetratricopeptide (TPR) repeat protein
LRQQDQASELAAAEELAVSYEGAFTRVKARIEAVGAAICVEGERADKLIDRVASLTAEELQEAAETQDGESDLATWEACRRLSELSASVVNSEPRRAVGFARLAAGVATKVAAQDAQSPLTADLEAAAWAQLGNALRVATDLRAAEEALDTAENFLVQGTGDPIGRAQLVGFMASLRADQRQYKASLALYRQARRLARRAGDAHLAGRILFNEARVHAYLKDDTRAIRDLERALRSIDPAIEPRLALVARHNLLSYLEGAGRVEEAWQGLAAVRTLAQTVGESLDRVRLTWLEGRIAARRDDLDHAESCYSEARDTLTMHELGYDVALVSLELAKVYLRQGATAKVKRLASSLVSVFAAHDVQHEARRALRVVCQAAEAERVGLALVDEVQDYLERARSEPSLRFRADETR